MLSTKTLPLATAYMKTAPEFIGPLRIVKAFYSMDNYTNILPCELNIYDIFNVKTFKPYISNYDKVFPNYKNTKHGNLLEFDEEDRYEVERIVRAKSSSMTDELLN